MSFNFLCCTALLGGANLRVHVSLELPNEKFDPELTQSGSEMFNKKTALLEIQVMLEIPFAMFVCNKSTKFQFPRKTGCGT